MLALSSKMFAGRLHGVQADDSQLVWNDFHREPPALLELVPLRLRDKAAPDIQVLHRPLVRSLEKDVVRHDVVIAKCWHDRNHIVVDTSAVLVRHAEYLAKLLNQELVLADDLLLRARMFLVVVVSRRVARPNYEVDIILDIVFDPFERLIHQRKWRIAT